MIVYVFELSVASMAAGGPLAPPKARVNTTCEVRYFI